MSRWLLILVAVTGSLGAEPAKKDGPKEKASPLEGFWTVTAAEYDGNKGAADAGPKLRIAFASDKVTIEADGMTQGASTYKLNPNVEPNQIDFLFLEGPEKGKSAKGVYKLNADTLTICMAQVGKDRPTTFDAKKGTELSLLVLKREKAGDTTSEAVKGGVLDVLKARNCTTLLKAIDAAGLSETLKGKGPYTVFAPSDKAFEQLPKGTLDDLLKPENKDKLVRVLKHHVLAQRATTTDFDRWTTPGPGELVKVTSVKSMAGTNLWFSSKTAVDEVKIGTADVRAENGIAHLIEKVLMPKNE